MAKRIDAFQIEVGINKAQCTIYKEIAKNDAKFFATFMVEDDQKEVGPFDIAQPREDVYLKEFRRYVRQHVNALLYFRNRMR